MAQPASASVLDRGQYSSTSEVGGQSVSVSVDNKATSADDVVQISWKMRTYRNIVMKDHWSRAILRYVIYGLYLAHVVTTVIFDVRIKEGDLDNFRVKWVDKASFYAWIVLIALNSVWFVFLGGRQHFAWHGYPVLILHAFELAIIALFLYSLVMSNTMSDNSMLNFDFVLLILMGFYLFTKEQLVLPIYRELRLFYWGSVSEENKVERKERYEAGEYKGAFVNGELLFFIFDHARKALNIHEGVPIRKALEGHCLRSDPEERRDDWVAIVNKLSTLVSLAPGFCHKDTKMTSLQYRNLVRQFLVYGAQLKKTGTMDATDRRTLPLSLSEILTVMLKLSWHVKWSFLHALIPTIIPGILLTAAMPIAMVNMTEGLLNNNQQLAITGFIFFVLSLCIGPAFFKFWEGFATSSYVSKLGDFCRRKMLDSLLKGGTEYGEIHPDGKLTDAFSAQLM